ncbi:MAG: hypothetical protein U0822_11525 [Anaerolineae bacterium]
MLRRTVARPRSAAALLACHASELEFRLVVQAIFPDEAADIWQVRQAGTSRETTRVEAFLRRVEERFFPVYEAEEYDQVAWAIPFVRLGWSYEDFHDLERRLGELLLLALCEAPTDIRVALLDWAEAHVPSDVLARIPREGFSRAEMHTQFDNTSCSVVAEFVDWLWGETGTAFLDLDDEIEVTDAGWSSQNVLDLAEQWREAQAILDRIEGLVTWLEADPAAHFAQLVDAALGDDTHLLYERSRRLYELEITERGLVPVEHDDVALPVGAAA